MSLTEAVALKSTLSVFSEMIQLMEGARAYAEESLDSLPGIFAMVDPKGRVFRGNRALAKIMDLEDSDLLLGKQIHEIFAPEIASEFLSKLQFNSESFDVIELELPVQTRSGIRIFHWGITPHRTRNAYGIPLLDIIGTDVTTLRSTQARVMEIYGTLPIGIIAVDSNGKFLDSYTAHTSRLIGRDLQSGEDIESALFPEESNRFSKEERERIRSLLQFKSQDQIVFEAAREACPSTSSIVILRNQISTEVHLGFSFQAVMREDRLQKVLIIIEDRTRLVLAQESAMQDQSIEKDGMRRIFEIKRIDPLLLPIFLEEIQGLFERLSNQNLPQERKATLHAIKGNARGARFEKLTSLAHSLETVALQGTSSDWTTGLSALRSEWDEIFGLAGALSSSQGKSETRMKDNFHEKGFKAKSLQNQIRELSLKSFSGKAEQLRNLQLVHLKAQLLALSYSDPSQNLEPWLRTLVESTAQGLGKEIDLRTDWGGVVLTDAQRALLSETLLHLCTNAIDHGIELPLVRKKLRKPLHGQLQVTLKELKGSLQISIKDDGSGINLQKIRDKAGEKKLLPSDWSNRSAHDQESFLLDLLFEEGFSTLNSATLTSGRGIGLSSVKSLLLQNGGTLSIARNSGKKVIGTEFRVQIPIVPAFSERPSDVRWSDLLKGTRENWAHLAPGRKVLLQASKALETHKKDSPFSQIDLPLFGVVLHELFPPQRSSAGAGSARTRGKTKASPIRAQAKADKKNQVLVLQIPSNCAPQRGLTGAQGLALHLLRQWGIEPKLAKNRVELRIPNNSQLDAAPRKSLKTVQR